MQSTPAATKCSSNRAATISSQHIGRVLLMHKAQSPREMSLEIACRFEHPSTKGKRLPPGIKSQTGLRQAQSLATGPRRTARLPRAPESTEGILRMPLDFGQS